MPNIPEEYNPTYKGYNKSKKVFPYSSLEEIAKVEVSAAKKLKEDNFCTIEIDDQEYNLYQDANGRIYCEIPDSKLGKPGTFAVTSVCQNIETGAVFALRKSNDMREGGMKDDVDAANKLAAKGIIIGESYLSWQLKQSDKEDQSTSESETTDSEPEDAVEEPNKSKLVTSEERVFIDSVQIMPLFSGRSLDSEFVNAVAEEKAEEKKKEEQKEAAKPRTDTFVYVELSEEQKLANEAEQKALAAAMNVVHNPLKFAPIPDTFVPATPERIPVLLASLSTSLGMCDKRYRVKMKEVADINTSDAEQTASKVDDLVNLDQSTLQLILKDVIKISQLSVQKLQQWHANGFLHGDIKPPNAMYDGSAGVFNFCDYGTMMCEGEDGLVRTDGMLTKKTTNPNAVGSLLYMAPELQEQYYKAMCYQRYYIFEAELEFRVKELKLKQGEKRTLQEEERKVVTTLSPEKNRFKRLIGIKYKAVRSGRKPISVTVNSDSTAMSILNRNGKNGYRECKPFVYSEKTDIFGLGISLEIILSHKIQSLISGVLEKVSNEIENRAYCRLPKEYNNPNNNSTIALINELLKIIHGLDADEVEKRWSLQKALDRLAVLSSAVEDLEAGRPIKIFEHASDIDEEDHWPEEDAMDLDADVEPQLEIEPDFKDKKESWETFQTTIKAIHPTTSPVTRAIDAPEPFTVTQKDTKTICITENNPAGYPVNKIEIQDTPTSINSKFPGDWFRIDQTLTHVRQDEISAIIKAMKDANVHATGKTKIVISNCVGRPDVARLMYKLAKEQGCEPVYGTDGSDPRGFLKRRVDAAGSVFKRHKGGEEV